MNLFGRNKKSKNVQKLDVDSNWNKGLKRNNVNKTGTTQEDFEFSKIQHSDADKDTSGSKKGLSLILDKITQDQVKILKNCDDENSAVELRNILKRTNRTKFKKYVLDPLIDFGFFELTIPEKPKSPKQKYRLTNKFVNKKVSN